MLKEYGMLAETGDFCSTLLKALSNGAHFVANPSLSESLA
jgi:hypothetical protein